MKIVAAICQFILPILWGFLSQIAILFISLLIFSVIVNSRMLTISDEVLREWIDHQTPLNEEQRAVLIRQGYERLELYEHRLKENYLVDGMLVNRANNGEALDLCDSLLFSSLRFAALKKLDRFEDAQTAWQAIETAKDNGHWFRHPSCREDLSRDMLVGLLVALSQNPHQGDFYLQALADKIQAKAGFFSQGSFHESFLTPDVKNTLDNLLILNGISKIELFWFDFSFLDWQVLFANDGYQSHLIALQIWMEYELQTLYKEKGRIFEEPVSPTIRALNLLSIFTKEPIKKQRLRWITHHLYANNRQNLFFKWLHLKSTGLLDENMRFLLLKELLEMHQFPSQHLPKDCERKADYLWQRQGDEYRPNTACTMSFNGSDFLWMIALLLGA
ncbi:MAG: hypothetical protein HYW48_03330 [Deltaproteobacteria bacterium]|nr:hypothetical protein [Deltaproteobacteria bacterium]